MIKGSEATGAWLGEREILSDQFSLLLILFGKTFVILFSGEL